MGVGIIESHFKALSYGVRWNVVGADEVIVELLHSAALAGITVHSKGLDGHGICGHRVADVETKRVRDEMVYMFGLGARYRINLAEAWGFMHI